jgi:hypothetical protein
LATLPAAPEQRIVGVRIGVWGVPDEASRIVMDGALQELGRVLARFGVYDQRFDHAAVRVASGDHDWFTKPSIDSYHTVWFELHENLLATLGIDRSSEQSEE